MPITTVDPAINEPVTLSEVRAQCRIDDDITAENGLLQSYITAAREYCEQQTGRHFAEKTLRYSGVFDNDGIELCPGLTEVLYVEYLDPQGATKQLSAGSYYIDRVSLVGSVLPLRGWPAVLANHPHPVTVEFECGGQDCPTPVKQAILLLVAHWYSNREAGSFGGVSTEVAFSVSALLQSYKVVRI
ncbi:MAG: head-tail connector protein [Amphritea sp.]|nr:head-tail connector protein [Amphritea sp.]